MTSFKTLPLRPETRAALDRMAVTVPTPIQSAALPPLLEGRDLIGQARTGSGKTLAFVLPMVDRVAADRREVQGLVLVPTRELAAQVAGVVRDAVHARPLRVLLLVGGSALGPQRQALTAGVQIVVGTPGRVLDHISQGNLRLGALRMLVLDEADEMLDRGFAPDVERIIAATNPARQTALLSATVPDWINRVAARHLRNPISVRVDAEAQPVEHVQHTVYDVPTGAKFEALQTLLSARGPGVTLVFGRTKHGVRRLARQLEAAGYPAAALQGNLSQNARERVMTGFRSGDTPILVATNVAARGLDVEHVERVINYELPETAALLTHRVGRTGRMGRSGEAVTLLSAEDEAAWRKLARDLTRHPVRQRWQGRHEPGTTAAIEERPARPPVMAAPRPTLVSASTPGTRGAPLPRAGAPVPFTARTGKGSGTFLARRQPSVDAPATRPAAVRASRRRRGRRAGSSTSSPAYTGQGAR